MFGCIVFRYGKDLFGDIGWFWLVGFSDIKYFLSFNGIVNG